ncbi:MAG: hypothetical protein M3209_07205 [Acidobacteriota bacterium]|nr:hypothetical protein [Acidobacteriota bacterium]
MKIEQNELAVKFLLGKLSEEEQTRIEEDYFQNNALFEDIQIAENDLIDAYVGGNLSTEDQQRFENRLLLNPQQRQRVEFAKTLFRYASNQNSSGEGLTYPSIKPKWRDLLSRFLSVKPMFSLSFAAIALAVLSVGIWWTLDNSLKNLPEVNRTDELAKVQTPKPIQNSESPQQSGNEINNKTQTEEQKTPVLQSSSKSTQPQHSPKKQVEQPQQPKTIISTIVLPLGVTRDANAAKVIEIPAKATHINLQLKFEEGNYASYSAVLETVEGQQIWRRQTLKPTKGKSDKVVAVTIPSHLLKKGDYIITLKGLTEKGTYEGVGDYSFTINPK